MTPGEIHGLHKKIVDDLRAEVEHQRTRAEAAERALLELNSTIGNHPATAARAKAGIRAIEEAENRAKAAEQELREVKQREEESIRLFEQIVAKLELLAAAREALEP